MEGPPRGVFRLRDMRQAIGSIESLLFGKTLEELRSERVTKAALERFLEIVSEASRGVPEAWRLEQIGDQDWWRRLADIGNVIRHSYDKVDARMLWSTYETELPTLKVAIDAMLARFDRPD